jgi:hypothetical protein
MNAHIGIGIRIRVSTLFGQINENNYPTILLILCQECKLGQPNVYETLFDTITKVVDMTWEKGKQALFILFKDYLDHSLLVPYTNLFHIQNGSSPFKPINLVETTAEINKMYHLIDEYNVVYMVL